MEERQTEVIAELEDGICLARIAVDDLREQDMNARVMDDAKFSQLVSNIGKRGTLEQLPYCAETDRGYEIVSGHHRVRAARQAGLEYVNVLLDRSGLTRSAIAAKQLAHNAIEGTDDEGMLRKISALITDVDDMIETALDSKYFDGVMEAAETMPHVKVGFDWKTVQFTFFDFQLQDMKELCERVSSADFEGIADASEFGDFVEMLEQTKKFQDVKNVGAAIHAMTERALADYGHEDPTEHTAIAKIFGRAVIPEEDAKAIKELIAELTDEGLIENPWEVFGYIAGTRG